MMIRSISKFMMMVKTIITNARRAEILTPMKQFGVDEVFMDECDKKSKEASDIIAKQKLEYQELDIAYDNAYAKRDECEKNIKILSNILKLHLRDNEEIANRIGLYKPKKSKIDERIDQMQSFFLAVIEEPNLINELSGYKITQAIIEGYIADIQEYKELRSIVKSEKGQAENATKQRDKVLEELEFYVDKIRTIAKISLADSPQLLEELNVKVK